MSMRGERRGDYWWYHTVLTEQIRKASRLESLVEGIQFLECYRMQLYYKGHRRVISRYF